MRLWELLFKRMWWTLLWHGLLEHLILAQHSRLPSWFAFKLHSHLQPHSWSSGPLVGFPLPEQEVNLYILRPLCIFLITGSNYVVLLDTGHPYSSLSIQIHHVFLKYVLFPKKINTYLFSATLPYTYGPVFSILTHFFIQHTFVDLACTNNPSKKLGWLDRTDTPHWRRPCLLLPCHLSLYSIVTTKFVAAMSWKILYL